MSNIFEKLGIGLANAGKWIASAVKDVTTTTAKIEAVLKSEKPLEAPFVSGLSSLVADVETLIAASQSAVSSEGLNFAADSKAYADFMTLVDDFKNLAPIVEEAIDILEGKSATAS